MPLRRLRAPRPGDRGGGALTPFGYERAADAAGAVARTEGAAAGGPHRAGGPTLVAAGLPVPAWEAATAPLPVTPPGT